MAAAFIALGGAPSFAGQLMPDKWELRENMQKNLPQITDGKLETFCTLKGDELEQTLTMTIDMRTPYVLHRVYWCGNTEYHGQDEPAAKIKKTADEKGGTISVFVGDSPDKLGKVAEMPVPPYIYFKTPASKSSGDVKQSSGPNSELDIETLAEPKNSSKPEFVLNTEGDFRFPPITGRYVRLEAKGLPADAAWILGEIEIYGFDGKTAETKEDAVVLSDKAPDPLVLAAGDLSYYIGELTGKPIPIIVPDVAKDYHGTLYCIEDLKPLAKTYEEMLENQKNGNLPTVPVNVLREDRKVIFRAWPYRNVLTSVWTFLEEQGIHWTYPDPHGEFVPGGKGVNLKILPLQKSPSSDRIFANYGIADLLYKDRWDKQPMTAGYLYFWRNHWTATWCLNCPFGGLEVPVQDPQKERRKTLNDDYKEGFMPYSHSLSYVLPGRIMKLHYDWMGLTRGDKFGKENNGKRIPQVNPCFSNDEMIQFVADKAAAWAAQTPDTTVEMSLTPMDATSCCECDKCQAMNEPLVHQHGFPAGYFYSSDSFWYFVSEVAKRVKKTSPNARITALAYSNCWLPPRKIDRLPDNVWVDVCFHRPVVTNLPLESPANGEAKKYLEEWAGKCSHLGTYEYVIMNQGKESFVMPVPEVKAIVDTAKFMNRLGGLPGGTEATLGCIPYNPWNFYAYPRIRWKIDLPEDEILKEFFSGCFRESADAMLAYYKVMEDWQMRHDINLVEQYYYSNTPGSFPYPVLVEMSKHLNTAEKTASSWVVRKRLSSIRKGFDWLVEASGLFAEDLKSPDRFPVVGPGKEPVTITNKNVDIKRSWNKSSFPELCLYNELRAGRIVRFEKAGYYVLTIRTKTEEKPGDDNNKNRHFTAYAGMNIGEPVAAPEAKDKEYKVEVKADEGVWECGIRCSGGSAIYIKSFTIESK